MRGRGVVENDLKDFGTEEIGHAPVGQLSITLGRLDGSIVVAIGMLVHHVVLPLLQCALVVGGVVARSSGTMTVDTHVGYLLTSMIGGVGRCISIRESRETVIASATKKSTLTCTNEWMPETREKQISEAFFAVGWTKGLQAPIVRLSLGQMANYRDRKRVVTMVNSGNWPYFSGAPSVDG